MDVKKIIVGPLEENTFVIIEDNSAILVDPGSEDEEDVKKIQQAIGKNKLLAIILTHNHFDHIGGVHKFNVPIYMHPIDIKTIQDQKLWSLYAIHRPLTLPKEMISMKESLLKIDHFSFQIIHTPGHTAGSVCFLFKDCIFTGDTLFKGTYGRTDLGGSMSDMKDSLKKLSELPAKLIVYPGHGESTTIKDEKDWINKL